ncbi:MAG: hypothetical protein L0154_25215 [Chloroflexi bacterium]|nr:hypothetical protein [Chloroflexota bacterium]
MHHVLRLGAVWILLIMIITAIEAKSSSVRAGSCAEEDGSVTVADRIADSPIVLEGVVTDVFTYYEFLPDQQVAMVDVSTYFKGSGPATVSVAGFGSRDDCFQPMTPDDEPLLFFIINDAGTFRAYYGLMPNAAYLMTADLRADVLAAVEENAATPDPALDPNEAAFETAVWVATNVIDGTPPTVDPASVTAQAQTRVAALVQTRVAAQVTTVAPTLLPTAAVTTGTQEPSDDGDSTDVLPIIAGVFVLVLLLGVGLFAASRRGSPEV